MSSSLLKPPYPAHPREPPVLKHKLCLPGPLPLESADLLMIHDGPDESDSESHLLDTSEELFGALDITRDHPELHMTHLCDVYTYRDAPSQKTGSEPFATIIQVVGYAAKQLQAIHKILSSSEKSCILGVHRADPPYNKQLPPPKLQNSNSFSRLLQYLYEQQAVAIVQLDNRGRVGFLTPVKKEMWADGVSTIKIGERGSYMGQCYYFDTIQQWMSLLGDQTINIVKPIVVPPKNKKPKIKLKIKQSPPKKIEQPVHDDSTPTFQPYGDDDGPTFRPDDDHNDNGDENNNDPYYNNQNDDDNDDNPFGSSNHNDSVRDVPLWNPSGGDGGDDNDQDNGTSNDDDTPLWNPMMGDDDNGGTGGDSNNDMTAAPADDNAPLWNPMGTTATSKNEENNDPGGSSFLWAPDGGDDTTTTNNNNNGGRGNPWDNHDANDNNNNNEDDGFGMSFVANIVQQPGGGGGGTGMGVGGGGGPYDDDDEHDNNNNYAQDDEEDDDDEFHSNKAAQEADTFYSNLKRDMKSRAESRLYHMRSFNGWIKAMQIVELNPQTSSSTSSTAPIRVLDLACGKGGDLLKWVNYHRGVANYVGVDVARGSLKDAAERVQKLGLSKLPKCSFVCADLGSDVIGIESTSTKKQQSQLLTWTLSQETLNQKVPKFSKVIGGGVTAGEKFDVISIQFAIHYMMSTRQRARRFFKTCSNLLEIGGNLIATTIDARVILEHMMGLGLNWFEEFRKTKPKTNNGYGWEGDDNDVSSDKQDQDEEPPIVVKVGGGACQLKFERSIVKRLFELQLNPLKTKKKKKRKQRESYFGLTYTFTLVEGDDHEAGVGEAVDLPEWLSPIPMLTELAQEFGFEVESVENFHQFFHKRQQEWFALSDNNNEAQRAMYKMHVLNRDGSISQDEWDISRLYMAIKFTKVKNVDDIELSDDDDEQEKPKPETSTKNVPEQETAGVGIDEEEAMRNQILREEEMKFMAEQEAAAAVNNNNDDDDDDDETDDDDDDNGWGGGGAAAGDDAAGMWGANDAAGGYDDEDDEEEEDDGKDPILIAMATKKAKAHYGPDRWSTMTSIEKTQAMETFYED